MMRLEGTEGIPDSIPDSVVPITARRAWYVLGTPGKLRLASLVFTDIWPPRKRFEAFCYCSYLSGREHKCGIHAARSSWGVKRFAILPYMVVAGTVKLWGRVTPFEGGYRAQYAYPKVLYLPRWARAIQDELSSTYGVPVLLEGWSSWIGWNILLMLLGIAGLVWGFSSFESPLLFFPILLILGWITTGVGASRTFSQLFIMYRTRRRMGL